LCHRQINVLTFASSLALKQCGQNCTGTLDCRVDIGVTKRIIGIVATARIALTFCHAHLGVNHGGKCATINPGASAILAALFQRERTGEGQYIDLSMAQTLLYVNEHAHDDLWDQPVSPDAIRSFRPEDYAVLTTRDGVTSVVSGHPAERGTFDFFVAAMQQPQLLEDPRFKTVSLRIDNLDALMQLIKDWASTIETVHELEQRLAEHKLAMGQLRSVAEVAKTDWAKQRNAFIEVDDRGDSTVKLPNSPWRFSGSDTSTRGTVKYRGEDNAEVFSELLGLSPNEIEELHQREILVQRLANNK